ncbi:mechanosensitive ion channel protein [Sphingobacterium cellulitidis]|uniref:mechanosensitive ion channel family protein n=1 Tax=Sphingobacterium cellulitidis TaxID=1768011 RepID=UPI000B941A52|nr:mechanosensitive ion channel domain-containing protein [Sphingobacterium cellulitidis]OYD42240.1 mechanosensitive ion channel protein [Sphingobacterium cellulitidis]OYD45398.1 mechanosensitive ion channel protein [Sphingobacterium cellulitidis]
MQNANLNGIESKVEKFIDSAIAYAPALISSLISATLVLFFGLWMIKLFGKLLNKIFEKRDVDPSIRTFLGNFLNWLLKIILFIVVVSQLGVQTSTFIAVIGAAGLAIGMSLQGSLSNFAGGVLILLFKPFRVGDYISSSSGVDGTVKIIDIFNTKLVTPQNQLVIIPNGELSNSNITNYSELGTRRTWFNIGVGYDTDLKAAKKLLLETISKNEFAFKEPAPDVVVTELGDSAINLSIRVTTSNDNFWAMQEQLIINCKEDLDKAGIDIPFPQTDIHIKK